MFLDDAERERFVELLGCLSGEFGIEVHCYCLMGNHYHLLVRSLDGCLSEAMKWLGAQFTKFVNARRGVDGAVFRGRFHSVQVIEESHLSWLFRYINANPLALGWTAPLIEYPWSGLAASVGRTRRTPWLCTDYSDQRFARSGQLEAFVEAAREVRRPDGSNDSDGVAGLSEDHVRSAAIVARLAGPDICSDADLRSATIVVAVDHVGLEPGGLAATGDLKPASRRRMVQRARQRAESQPVQSLVDRMLDVLTVQRRIESSGV